VLGVAHGRVGESKVVTNREGTVEPPLGQPSRRYRARRPRNGRYFYWLRWPSRSSAGLSGCVGHAALFGDD
jgi:hypothetical protein